MTRNLFHRMGGAALLVGLTSLAVLTTGCDPVVANSGAAGSSAATATPSGPIDVGIAGHPVTSPGSKRTGSTPDLKFPNKSLENVLFVKYDAQSDMVEFQKTTQAPHSDSPELIPDPSDPAIHRLHMAAGAKIKYLDGETFDYNLCRPNGCTDNDKFYTVLDHNPGMFYADIHVNAADQIDSVDKSSY